MTYTKRFEVRLTEEERKLISEAAWSKRMRSSSEWARKVLIATAKAHLKETDGRVDRA